MQWSLESLLQTFVNSGSIWIVSSRAKNSIRSCFLQRGEILWISASSRVWFFTISARQNITPCLQYEYMAYHIVKQCQDFYKNRCCNCWTTATAAAASNKIKQLVIIQWLTTWPVLFHLFLILVSVREFF